MGVEGCVDRNLNKHPCTQVISAHRLRTVRHADTLLVLDQGRIIEQGSHQELVQRNGHYANLIRSQLTDEEEKKQWQRERF